MIQDRREQSSLDFDAFAQNLASAERRIVYVGLVDSEYKLRYSNFRQGGKIYADFHIIRNLLTFAPRLVVGDLEKLEPTLGKIDSVLVRFKKRALVLSRLEDHIVVVGFDTEVPTPFPEFVAGLIKTAAKKARTT